MILARYGEVHLKGKNRAVFMRALTTNLRNRLKGLASVKLVEARYIIDEYKAANEQKIIEITANTFGLTSVSPVTTCSHSKIEKEVSKLKIEKTFRVTVNRADKKFQPTGMEFAAILGGAVLKSNPNARVDLHNPETTIFVDIRENDCAYIYDKVIPAVGGMPYGTSGKALCLLSGGIDSPVATWLAAKRGLSVECIHFTTPPYTSAFSESKVKKLAQRLGNFCGEIPLHIVSLTDIMTEIKQKCDASYTITLMRRAMIKIAKNYCLKRGIDCIITGENLAQVASQTIAGITTTNAVAGELPILRPLVTYDKIEIMNLAKKIGTYDISIEPHDDCCTVFVPESPVINPKIKKCEYEERKLATPII